MEVVETYLKRKEITDIQVDNISSPKIGVSIFTQMFGEISQECLGLLCLDSKNKPTHYSTVYKGTVNQIAISPKDILKVALLSNATSIMIAHNHPSTDIRPSHHDIETTRNIAKACDTVDIKLLDHLIINSKGDYYSIREHHTREFSAN